MLGRNRRPRRKQQAESEPERGLKDLVLETIDRQGPYLLAAILKTKAERQPPPGKPAKEIARLAKARMIDLYQELRDQRPGATAAIPIAASSSISKRWMLARKLPNLLKPARVLGKAFSSASPTIRDGTELGLKLTVYSATFFGGLLFGYGLPETRLKLFRRGTPQEGVTLHSAAYFSVDVMLRWISGILNQAILHRDATEEDKQRLRLIERVFQNLLEGIQTGVSAHRPQPAAESNSTNSPGDDQSPDPSREVAVPLDEQSYRMVETFFQMLRQK